MTAYNFSGNAALIASASSDSFTGVGGLRPPILIREVSVEAESSEWWAQTTLLSLRASARNPYSEEVEDSRGAAGNAERAANKNASEFVQGTD